MSEGNDKEAVKKVLEAIDQMDMPELEKTVAKMVAILGGNPTDILISGAYRQLTAEAESKYPRQPTPEDYSEVERILHEMLTENTGIHPLDSGFAYGWHWVSNRAVKDFRETPEVYVYEDVILVNVFHYLAYYLERDGVAEELERRLYEFADLPENRDLSWLGVMEEFAEELEEEGWSVYTEFNTYNFDNFLSQVLQGIVIERGEDSYIILQIHNGCDVRGGYTKPRVFRLTDPEEFFYNMDRVLVGCDCETGEIVIGEGFVDFSGDRMEWPEHWQWNEEKKRYVCERCGKPLEFGIYYPE